MSSLSSYTEEDHHVKVLCSRLAQHTYEVCIARATDPENHDFSVVDIWPGAEDLKFHSEGELNLPARSDNSGVLTAAHSADTEKPRCLLHNEEAEQSTQDTSRHVPPARPSFYFDASSGRYRTGEQEGNLPEDTRPPQVATLKTARQKLIEFLKKDEFFDEYSFLALMALLLAHMFRLTAAIFAMGCRAPTIIDVFVCVWRFMHNRVDDIMVTDGDSSVSLKCVVFSAELLVIFICIFIFLWTVFIPVCDSLAGITSKILYLFT